MIKHTFRSFVMPLSNLVLEMGMRGVRVDAEVLRELRIQFEAERTQLVRKYRRIVAPIFNIREIWQNLIGEQNKTFLTLRQTMSVRNKLRKQFKSWLNPNSSTSQRKLLYEILKLPVQRTRKEERATANEEAIVKLSKLKAVKQRPEVSKLLETILALREVTKKISTYCLEE